MAMKNLDVLQQKKAEIMNKINQAVKDGDEEAFAKAFTEFAEMIQEAVLQEAKGYVQAVDNQILAGRGVRPLTSEERTYYEKVIAAMKSSNPRQALADLDVVLPKTVIDAVFEDLVAEHPLLDVINFQNTSGLSEYIVNTHTKQLAKWGPLTSAVVQELTSGFRKIDLQHNKLSAFIPVAKSMLDLGPAWLDRYVRAVLAEALALGLEEGIINGNGVDCPVGMNRDITAPKDPVNGIPEKTPVPVTKLDPVTYGQLLSTMAIGPNGQPRVITEVVLIVNPVDYLTKIMPATTVRRADGTYANNVFPFPTRLIQSVQVPTGRAIFGLANRYFMGIGTQKSGRIEYSDEYKFLEDERVYLIKLYGHGEPLDNNAFVYADISGLEPTVQQVYVVNASEFPGVPEA